MFCLWGVKKKNNDNTLTTEEFIEKAKKIHGDKYDYSKVNYIKSINKVCIICPEHGEFWQTPHKHLLGRKCPKCSNIIKSINMLKSINDFIKESKKTHDLFYDYSKVEYKGINTKVCIICPEHGEFWQTPREHLSGCGCQICSRLKNKSEARLLNKLKTDGYNIIWQKRFKWLGKQSLDFYLPDYNIAIEYQGEQHFIPIIKFGGEKEFEKIKERDERKYKLCMENGVTLYYFSFSKRNIPKEYYSKIITNYNDLKKHINNENINMDKMCKL